MQITRASLAHQSHRCAALFLFLTTASGFQQNAAEPDVYAIYSILLQNPSISHGGDNNPTYLIRDTTVPGTPREPCVSPPASQKTRWAEVMADFGRRQDTLRKLEPAFTISKPFQLLTKAEADQFVKDRFLPAPPSSVPRKEVSFREVVDLFSLSNVYFNQDHTLALTALSSWCGGLCGLWRWRVFEKGTDGKWTEKDWITCTTMS